MRTLQLVLAGTVTLALLGGLGVVALGQEAVDEPVEPESFMFVGNSLLFWNAGAYREFEGLVAAEEPPRTVEVMKVVQGGVMLDALHRMSVFRLENGEYDLVVLQDDIPEYPDRDIGRFMANARLFDGTIRDFDAATVFIMAWPYHRLGWVALDEIVALHRQAERELGTTIAPVALAMARAQDERLDLEMLGPDAEHPSEAGTYLAGAVIYATVFDRSPEGLSYCGRNLLEEDCVFLQRIAWEAVQEWRAGAPAE